MADTPQQHASSRQQSAPGTQPSPSATPADLRASPPSQQMQPPPYTPPSPAELTSVILTENPVSRGGEQRDVVIFGNTHSPEPTE
jgi:hypothetical protein